MDQKNKQKLEESLKKEEAEIISELSSFAQEDSKGNWIVPFPNEGQSSEENAKKLEEFERLNVLKNNLTGRLENIQATQKKLENDAYGQCEKCLTEIDQKRLKVVPAARFCIGCAKQGIKEI